MRQEFENWFYWQYHAKVTNTAVGDQVIAFKIQPGEGERIILLYGY